jgi:MOSC domain-containing protein YiiM/ferredoxin-NADP reductase
MMRLLSVNVGLPRDIPWKGRIVHTGIWKDPVAGRCRAGRLNLEGDGQGDLAGHGGEHRAVFVYQIESYRYWEQRLGRTDLVHGQFGENLTVEGLPDDVVCVGDRYRIGSALFEVTQPRVTCYRVGIRMNEPRMPALLTSSGRPGFYFRVLKEGDVGAGDEIVKIGEATERMTVSQLNALLYEPGHAREALERALRIQALSAGWRASFEALLQSRSSGNAGLIPDIAAHPSPSGFQRLEIIAITQESVDVISLTMHSADGRPLPAALPGQYVVVRIEPAAGVAPAFRSYSLSGPVSTECYRISVKLEQHGLAAAYIRHNLRLHDILEVSAPRGSFILRQAEQPVVLISAGIGATPVLAMLHALSAAQSTRQVLWLHGARDGRHHPFDKEVSRLMQTLAHARSYVVYSSPDSSDVVGCNFDAVGHISEASFRECALPNNADVYLCGPNRFMSDMTELLLRFGLSPEQIHEEIFNGGESMTPGVVRAPKRPPHPLADDANTGQQVSFARSGVAVHWNKTAYQSILELAESCDVPVRWSCRSGVCHSCESGLVSGSVRYDPDPLDRPADGNILICCSQPTTDIVVDL